jgi:hypothetical protein
VRRAVGLVFEALGQSPTVDSGSADDVKILTSPVSGSSKTFIVRAFLYRPSRFVDDLCSPSSPRVRVCRSLIPHSYTTRARSLAAPTLSRFTELTLLIILV